jgi:DNA polymerase elongation subunit (family B)
MKTLIFDIETIAQNEERLLALAPEFKPASNLKDPAKIAESIERKRADYLADAALNWKTAEVVLIGMGDGVEFESRFGDEKDVLREFMALIHSAMCDGCKVGGHNVKNFDLPMIVNRARVHGLNIPEGILQFWKGRAQWADNIFDTLEILSFGDRQKIEGCGVEDVARAFGLPGKLGHGSDFPALWKSAREQAIAYNRRDVEIEIEIARVCGLI